MIVITKNNKFHARTKHINIRHHFIHEAVEQGMVGVEYVPTGENVADGFTKLLPRPAFETFVWELALLPV